MVEPEIILGPPGTGKTTSLIKVVEEEIAAGTPPDRIAYVSFTRKAAKEAITRAMRKFGLPGDGFPYFRTLHSLCFRVSGTTPAQVMDNRSILEFGKWIGVKMTGKINFEEGSTYGNEVGDRCLFLINGARARGKDIREHYLEDNDGLPWLVVDRVWRGLVEYKRSNNLVDYADMLELFVQGSYSPDLDVAIVDEAQDLSDLQWRVVDKLATSARRLVIAGDDDQAIYRWAGADVDGFLSMRGRVRVLGQSYRVPSAVQRLSSGIISRVSRRRPKEWKSRDEEGVVRRVSKIHHADFSGPDVLVLARNSYLLEECEQHVRGLGILYYKRGNPSVDPAIVNAIRDWETLRGGGSVSGESARRVYGYLSSGTGVARGYKALVGAPDSVDMELLRSSFGLRTSAIWHEALERIPASEKAFILVAARHGQKFTHEPSVRLSTIHGSKGGEADHVIILTDMAKRTFEEFSKRGGDDEHRVWYVAATRAKRQVTIVDPSSTNFFRL